MAKKGKEKDIEKIKKEKLEEKETEKTEEKENKVTENLKLFNYDDMNKEVVYHNDFSNTIFTDFSLKEKQLLLFLIAGINNEDSNDKIYHFDPKEIKNMLSMERKSYGELSKIVHSIQKNLL
ncbi:replication initiation protein (plasmid) [Fusobacterium sp. SB021]|uniref:replication initiation protein n=1 Tax=Fusobacterium sp. SB021 TaxID=2744227 RepID=UPI003CF2BA15